MAANAEACPATCYRRAVDANLVTVRGNARTATVLLLLGRFSVDELVIATSTSSNSSYCCMYAVFALVPVQALLAS